MDGLFLVDKPSGATSRQIDNFFMHRFDEKGVGHLGTLDPFATGLLIVGIGQGTKVFPFLDDKVKTYQATLSLGKKTDTGELTGETIAEKVVPELDATRISKALSSFVGKMMQTPPAYSAKSVNGLRSYKAVRLGVQLQLKPRQIEIFALGLLNFDKEKSEISFEAVVSKGTYIRTLGEDLAEKLGTVGHLVSLRRLSVGPFPLAKAKKPEEISALDLLPLADSLVGYDKVVLSKDQANFASHGGALFISEKHTPLFMALNPSGKPIGIYGLRTPGQYVCLRGFKL